MWWWFSGLVVSDSCYLLGCSLPGMSLEFSRQEYWSGLPFPSPGYLTDPGIERGSCIAGRFFTNCVPGVVGKMQIKTTFVFSVDRAERNRCRLFPFTLKTSCCFSVLESFIRDWNLVGSLVVLLNLLSYPLQLVPYRWRLFSYKYHWDLEIPLTLCHAFYLNPPLLVMFT